MAKELLFYDIMKYPVPENPIPFLFCKKIDNKKPTTTQKHSWKQKNTITTEYAQHLDKYGRLYRSLPFVTHIYVCNSLSFNAPHEQSDIDLTIITQEGRIRTARLFTLIATTILGLKRRGKKTRKKRCLSFRLTKEHCNIFALSLPNTDIYLVYRLAHLIPLYSTDPHEKDILMDDNQKRASKFLPNHTRKQTVNIGTSLHTGKSKIGNIRERILSGKPGDIIERIIKNTWLPIIIRKKSKLPKEQQTSIIINNNRQKFHKDIRKKIQRRYHIKSKKPAKKQAR